MIPTIKNADNRPPKWNKWRLMPEIKEWEAVALSLNIEPGKIDLNSNAWMGAEHPFDESEEFIDRLMILKNHSSNRAHFPTPCKLNMANWYECEVRLDEFAAWCIHVGFEIPPELSALSKTATQAAPQSDSTPTTMIEAAKRAALDAENIAGMVAYTTPLIDKIFRPFAKSLDETTPRRQPPAFPTSNREEDTPAINVKAVAVTPPAPAAPPGNAGLSKRERQIRAIETESDILGYERLRIATGGKTTLRNICKKKYPLLFGAGNDPFNDAWKDAVHSSPQRLRMTEHNKFAG